MFKNIKGLVPKSLTQAVQKRKKRLNILTDFIYDYNRFLKFSGAKHPGKQASSRAFMIKEYHAIEKGLTLAQVRPGFGIARISNLINAVNIYVTKYDADWVTDACVNTLTEYKIFDELNNTAPNPVIDKINSLVINYKKANEDSKDGTKMITKSEILSAIDFDYSAFIKTRSSIRDFADVPVDDQLLMDAFECARHTPSVCNRQSWKAYIVHSSNTKLFNDLLKVQNGNRGFGTDIPTMIVVTGKLSSFFARERNQVFIDGGMFSMAIVLALHAQGLGACCLNTSYTHQENEAFKAVMKIDDDCVPIMFIAVGHLKETNRVATSTKKSVREILTIINPS